MRRSVLSGWSLACLGCLGNAPEVSGEVTQGITASGKMSSAARNATKMGMRGEQTVQNGGLQDP